MKSIFLKVLAYSLFICVALITEAQVQFSINLSTNYSWIPDQQSEEPVLNSEGVGFLVQTVREQLVETYSVSPGFNFSLNISKSVANRIHIESGIGGTYHRFTRNIEIVPVGSSPAQLPFILRDGDSFELFERTSDINVDPASSDLGKTRIFYLDIPLLASYSLIPNRLNAGIGMYNQFMVYSSQVKQRLVYTVSELNGFITPSASIEDYKDTSNEGLAGYQFSGGLFLEFRVFHKFWLSGEYRHALTPIYEEQERTIGDARFRTIVMGINYKLGT